MTGVVNLGVRYLDATVCKRFLVLDTLTLVYSLPSPSDSFSCASKLGILEMLLVTEAHIINIVSLNVQILDHYVGD